MDDRETDRMRTSMMLLCVLFVLACDVPAPPPNTGGTDIASGECGRGIVVVHTDYQSTNVGLLDWEGAVLSPSFISSASASVGLSAPLTGDVVTPTMAASSERILLLDRYPASVLTWVDVNSASVREQLSVATGFAANPHDYVEISRTKAYVPRYEKNFAPGHEPFDEGNDILIVDPSQPAITGRIDLTPAMEGEDPRFLPRASRALLAGDRLYVVLAGYSADFIESAPSRLVAIDTHTDTIAQVLVFNEMQGCDTLALSPDKKSLAVTCSGVFGKGSSSTVEQSGVVLVDLGNTMQERQRLPAAKFGEGPIAFSVSFPAVDRLLFTTLGRLAAMGSPGVGDAMLAFDLTTSSSEVLLRTKEPFMLGEVRCVSECGVCVLADAERDGGVIHRFEVSDDGRLVNRTEVKVDTSIGLPPRYLGTF